MATCPSCGTANVTGKFCGTCGAAVPQQAAAAMPTPPSPPPVPGPQGQAQPPWQGQPGGWQPPAPPNQQPGLPPRQPSLPHQGYPPQPGFSPAPVPPKKSGGALKVIGIVLGVIVGLFALLGLAISLLPDSDPVDGPTNVVDNKQPAAPPAQPATPPAQPTTDSKQTPAPAQSYPAKVLAQGTFDFSGYTSYGEFGGKQIALAKNDGEYVQATMYEFKNGTFEKVVEASYPHGQLNDVNHGPIFNDGKDYSIIPSANGMIITAEDGDAKAYDGQGVQHVLVGDWDADGRFEAMLVSKVTDGFKFTHWRYGADGQGEKLKTMDNFQFLGSPQVVKLSEPRSLIMGVNPEQVGDKLAIRAQTVNLDAGTFELYSLWTVPESNEAMAVGYSAANVKGKDTLVLSYKSNQSYLELFDVSKKGTYAPASLGTIKLPDGEGYSVVLGKFTQSQNREILAFTAAGKWTIYGF